MSNRDPYSDSTWCSLQIRCSESRSLLYDLAQLLWDFPPRPLSQKKMGRAIGRWYCPYFCIDRSVSCLRRMAFPSASPEVDR
jgi:hypothetical protein